AKAGVTMMPADSRNRIMIYGPKTDGTDVVEFRTAAGEALAISIPRTEASVVRHFQERMPYGLLVFRREYLPRQRVFSMESSQNQPPWGFPRPRPWEPGGVLVFAPTHGFALPNGRVFKRQESPGSRGSLWLLSVAPFVGGVSLPGGATCRDNPEQAKTVPEAAPRQGCVETRPQHSFNNAEDLRPAANCCPEETGRGRSPPKGRAGANDVYGVDV